MIPFGNHTVTLYHKDQNGYTSYTISGCSWRSANERSLDNGATVITERTTCRIPANYICPRAGDLLVLGNEKAEIKSEIDLVRHMEKLRNQGFHAFRVQACADNSGAPLPHFAATGA